MSENWNFHGHIALPLETITKAQGKIDFNADVIDAGAFVDAMLSVLQLDVDKLPLYAEFFRMCAQYQFLTKTQRLSLTFLRQLLTANRQGK